MFRVHFTEYLVGIVGEAKIDPLPIFDVQDCVQELRRRGIALPERGPWDTDPIYRDMCLKVIQIFPACFNPILLNIYNEECVAINLFNFIYRSYRNKFLWNKMHWPFICSLDFQSLLILKH